MGKRERTGTGRSSFGKRQKADDDFRKKRAEKGSSKGEGSSEGGSRERKSFKGSSYEGGRRKFSGGAGRSEGRREGGPGRSEGPRRSFGDGDKKPYRSNRFSGPREDRRDSTGDDKKPYRSSSRSSGKFSGPREDRGGDKRPYRSNRFSGPPRDDRRDSTRSRGEGPRGEDRRDDKRPYKPKRFSGASSDRPDRRDFKKDKPERRSFVEGKVKSHRERTESTGEKPKTNREPSGDGLIRLNKFISNSGVCSRREADELIKMGLITVNGVTITEMGHKVKPTDDVRHESKKLTAERPVYILLNKPKGFITTTDDPQERNTVMELIAGACKERVYPVGRLDRNTTGLLLLTNDGELTDKLTHPSFNAKKIYKVELDKALTKADFQKIVEGVRLEEGTAMVDDLAIVSDDNKTIGIELHIGWNHVVRRIFNALEYNVEKLDRVVYAGLDKKDLKRGQWRFLKSDEIVRLKHFK
jgi:23S rRNA pseudouridine2605 synthase